MRQIAVPGDLTRTASSDRRSLGSSRLLRENTSACLLLVCVSRRPSRVYGESVEAFAAGHLAVHPLANVTVTLCHMSHAAHSQQAPRTRNQPRLTAGNCGQPRSKIAPQSAFRSPPFVSFCKFPPFPVGHFPRRPKLALNCIFLQLIAPNCAKLQFPAI